VPDPITIALLATAGVGGAAAWRSSADEHEAPDGPDGTDIPATDDQVLGTFVPADDLDGRTMTYAVELWRPYVVELATSREQPVVFHMAWIARESGGNPGAVGSIHASGPDGYAREMGLYQLYNPDELQLAGVTSAQLRAGCAAPTGTQQMVRALTDDEMRVHVAAGVAYIAKRRQRADADLASVGASWSEQDTWRLVKLYHALTGLPGAALRGFKAVNGRAPANWNELRDFAQSADLTPYGGAGLARYAPYGDFNSQRGPLPNAEAVGGVVS
jgi:hypothetical protein